MPKYVFIVIRRDKAFVVSREGGPGIRWGIEPAFVASAQEASLAEALSKAIENAPSKFSGVMPNLRTRDDPISKAMGAKTVYASEKNTQNFELIVNDESITLEQLVPMPNRRSGLVIDHQWTKTFALSTPMRDIARFILDAAPSTPQRK